MIYCSYFFQDNICLQGYKITKLIVGSRTSHEKNQQVPSKTSPVRIDMHIYRTKTISALLTLHINN